MRHRLAVAARSILLGWMALFAITYLVERPLLLFTTRFAGASWFPTVQLALECAGLAATGWIIGRWNRVDAIRTALVFAVMLAAWDFGLVPGIDIVWLFRLIVDSAGSPRYMESLITSIVTHTLLFGSLLVGAHLSRPPQRPLSIARNVDKMDDCA